MKKLALTPLFICLFIATSPGQETPVFLGNASDSWMPLEERVFDQFEFPDGQVLHYLHYEGQQNNYDSEYKIFEWGTSEEWTVDDHIDLDSELEYSYKPGAQNNSEYDEDVDKHYVFTFNKENEKGAVYRNDDLPSQALSATCTNAPEDLTFQQDLHFTIALNQPLVDNQKMYLALFESCSGEFVAMNKVIDVGEASVSAIIAAAHTDPSKTYRVVTFSSINFSLSGEVFGHMAFDPQEWASITLDGASESAITFNTAEPYDDQSYDVLLYKQQNDQWDYFASFENAENSTVQVPAGQYLAKVTPHSDDFLSTYHNGEHNWQNAAIIEAVCGSTVLATVELALASNSNDGLGHISGVVLYNETNKTAGTPYPGIGVTLVDLNSNQAIAHTTTDDQGAYEFLGLEAGDYQVELDLPSFTTTQDVSVKIDQETFDHQQVFEVDVQNKSIELTQLITGVQPSIMNSAIELTISDLQLSLTSTHQLSITRIFGLNGQLVESKSIKDYNALLDVRSYDQGIYVIDVLNSAGGHQSFRFVR